MMARTPRRLDRRHKIACEFTGHPSGARWVFRFAGTYINSYPTREAARTAAVAWEQVRRSSFTQEKDKQDG